MPERFCFVAGLPRSGSTLLLNVLGQNPRFHVTSTSGVPDLINSVRAQWDTTLELKASGNDAAKRRVMAAILPAMYATVDKPVVFDKSRSWLPWLELLSDAYGDVKVLVPVRDCRAILASFEKLWRKNYLRWPAVTSEVHCQQQSVEGRCSVHLAASGMLCIAHNRVRDALLRGFRKSMCFVQYEDLCFSPAETMAHIYAFLGEHSFTHDFKNIKQITVEDDAVYGFGKLHEVRTAVVAGPDDWKEVLGPFGEQFARLNFTEQW